MKFKLKKINLSRSLRLERLKKKTVFVLFLAIFIITTIVLSPIVLRLDLSSGRAYSLSSSTTKILKNLKDKITIDLLISDDLPTRLLPLKNEVLDFIKEYERASIKIVFKESDPKKDSKALELARSSGIPELSFSELNKDKYAVTTAYFGLVLSYKDKKEVIPQLTNTENLEYSLTSAIYKMTKSSPTEIAILNKDYPANTESAEVLKISQIMGQQFDIRFIEELDPKIKTSIIFDDNKKEYTDEEISKIKDYLDKGGKIIFFVDGVWVADSLQVLPARHNLFDFFKDYGIVLNKDLILSTSAQLVSFGNSQMSFYVPYPFWLQTSSFSGDSSLFSNINQLTFPWVSSINIRKNKNIAVEKLVMSTDKSWEQKEATGSSGFNLDPQSIPQPKNNELHQYTLAVDVKKGRGEFVLVPSSRFILDKYLSATTGNLEFIFNLSNNFASEGALSGIRSRQIDYYLLPDLTDRQKELFKYANIILLPGLFAVFGVVRLLRKSKTS